MPPCEIFFETRLSGSVFIGDLVSTRPNDRDNPTLYDIEHLQTGMTYRPVLEVDSYDGILRLEPYTCGTFAQQEPHTLTTFGPIVLRSTDSLQIG